MLAGEAAVPVPEYGMVEPKQQWLEGRFKHFSASSLRLLRVCPEAFRQRYVLGRKERPGGALTLGTAVHDAIAHNPRRRWRRTRTCPSGEVVECFHDYAGPRRSTNDGGVEEIRWDDGVKPDDYRRDGSG